MEKEFSSNTDHHNHLGDNKIAKKKPGNHAWRDFFESSLFRKILYVILGMIVLLLTFRTGMILGYEKATFSFHSGDNYRQIFLGPNQDLPGQGMQVTISNFGQDSFFNAHGIVGQIMEISAEKNGTTTLTLKDQDQDEQSVLVNGSTVIKRFQNTITPSDLKVGEMIVVIGAPDDSGQIDAKLVRDLSTSPSSPSSSPQPPSSPTSP